MGTDNSSKTGFDEVRSSVITPIQDHITVDSKAGEEFASEVNESEQDSAVEQSLREKAFSRRALIQSGWTVPVILAVGLSKDAKAQLLSRQLFCDICPKSED